MPQPQASWPEEFSQPNGPEGWFVLASESESISGVAVFQVTLITAGSPITPQHWGAGVLWQGSVFTRAGSEAIAPTSQASRIAWQYVTLPVACILIG